MVTAVFTDNDDYARAYGLWQWDYGQQLRIEGLHLPTAVEIHFALQETGGEAITRVGTTKDGVTTVTIPDSMLEGNRATWTADKAYNIYAWVYLSDKSSGETIKRITMQVKSRPKPEAFEAPGDGEIFHEAIEAVNDAAKRAEEAGDKAIAAADEAEKAATQTAEHLQATEGLAEQVETNADTVAQDKQAVAGMLSQTQQVASDAALSAQEAKLSETAAVQAQAGAEAAEDGARQYAEETRADRQAVTEDKQAVSQMREDVAADRQAVEQTALQFGQTSQDALTAIGQAQSTAVGAVKAEGQKQTTAVQEAGTQAVSEVTEAKTTAVQAVTTEGDKQTKTLEDAKNKENAIGFVVPSSASPYKSVYTSKGNGVLVCWIAGKWTDGKTTIHECTESELLQLEIGSEATTYEPPRIPQPLTLQTPNGLPGVPVSKDGNYTDQNGQQWVCDEIDLERGKYVQRVKEINPADYDRWISDKTTGNLRFKIIGTDAAKKTVRSEILSNRFTFLSSGHMLGGSFTYNSDVYFYLPSTVTTVEECKQWFVDNQTTIYYQLETPIERDLTPEEIAAYKALHTNYPTTVISNDAGAHMEVAYVADTKNYIHNLEERLNAKLVNIQSALISQKISGGWGA